MPVNFGLVLSASLAVAVVATVPAFAAPNLIINGDFETTSATQSTQIQSTDNTTAAQKTATSNLTGWYTQGYNFLFLSNSAAASGTQADTTGATNGLRLWGPGDGVANGLTTSPAGRNFIAADNNYPTQPTPPSNGISQTVNNLIIGQGYALSYYWAAAQQQGYIGATQEQWTVSFGSQTQATDTINLASQGFSGWLQKTMLFTASATTQTLTFLATGSPGGNPPFSLLDGVSLVAVAVPEPGTWALMLTAVIGFGATIRFGRRALRSGGNVQA